MAGQTVKVRFNTDVEFNGGGNVAYARKFEKGKTYDVTPDVAQKWVTRNKAELLTLPDGATANRAPQRQEPAGDEVDGDEDGKKDAGDEDEKSPNPATTKNSKGIVAPGADKSHANRPGGTQQK